MIIRVKHIVGIVLLLGVVSAYTVYRGRQINTHPSPYDFQDPGRSWADMLRSDKYTALEVEVQYMPGRRLQPETIDTIEAFLQRICDKPDGVHMRQKEIDVSFDTCSLEQVMATERLRRTSYTGGNTITVYVLVTNGYSDVQHTAAFTYYNTSIVVFGGIIERNRERIGRVRMETYLLIHEFSHIMGLVNMGTPMQTAHEDSVFRHHCIDSACTMHQGSTSTQLDSACLRDLRAARERPVQAEMSASRRK